MLTHGVVLGVHLAAPLLERVVGRLALQVQTRLFGMILAAIAAQLIVVGLGEVFPAWVEPHSEIQEELRSDGVGQDPS